MNPSLTETPALSRRGVLKIGLCASAFLATAGLGASLSGCSSSTPASGFVMLRSSDLPFLRAVIPVLLEGVASAQAVANGVEDTLKKLDFSLQRLSPEMFKLTQWVQRQGATRSRAYGQSTAFNRKLAKRDYLGRGLVAVAAVFDRGVSQAQGVVDAPGRDGRQKIGRASCRERV